MTVSIGITNYSLSDLGGLVDTRISDVSFKSISDAGTPARTPLYIVHPRPDSETNTWEQHRIAEEGDPYSTNISVEGGSLPAKFVLVNGPSGMTIGEFLTTSGDTMIDDGAYGVLSWSNPTTTGMPVDGWPIHIRVIGFQNLEVAQIRFTLKVGAVGTYFKYADLNDATSLNQGTYAEPYNTWTSIWGDLSTDNVNGGFAIKFKAGTHSLAGFTDTSGNANLGSGSKPFVFMAANGEAAVVDFSTAKITFVPNGFHWGDVKCINNDSTITGHFFDLLGGVSRANFFNFEFGAFTIGTSTNNNPACIYIPAAGATHFVMSRIVKSGATQCLLNCFNTVNSVVEFISLAGATFSQYDASSETIIKLKDSSSYLSCQYISFLVGTNSTATLTGISAYAQNGVDNTQIRYCNTIAPTDTHQINHNYYGGFGAGNTGPVWWDRCTMFGDARALEKAVTETYEGCVVIAGDANPIPTENTPTKTNCLEGASADSYINSSTGVLTGASRTSYLGSRGFEVAS